MKTTRRPKKKSSKKKKSPTQNTVTIAFEGLMLFQTDPGAPKQVVIVDGRDFHNHTPEVRIYRSNDGTPTGPLGQVGNPIPLSPDDEVAFDVAAGVINRDQLYDDHVPKLRDYIIFGDVDPKVVNQTQNGGVLAFVILPPGDLSTLGVLDHPVQLTKPGCELDTMCFARYVTLTTMVTTMTVAGQEFPIEPFDFIVVSNISSHNSGLHFPVYSKLLTDDGQLGPIKILKNFSCVTQAPETAGALRPAITTLLQNMNPPGHDHHAKAELGPIRLPNADCGPTGP